MKFFGIVLILNLTFAEIVLITKPDEFPEKKLNENYEFDLLQKEIDCVLIYKECELEFIVLLDNPDKAEIEIKIDEKIVWVFKNGRIEQEQNLIANIESENKISITSTLGKINELMTEFTKPLNNDFVKLSVKANNTTGSIKFIPRTIGFVKQLPIAITELSSTISASPCPFVWTIIFGPMIRLFY